MTTEVVPTNEFTIEFDEDKSLVTINFQGLQASRLEALEIRVDDIEDQLPTIITNAAGATAQVAADLNSLEAVVTAQGADIVAEEAARIAADQVLNDFILAVNGGQSADVAAEEAARIAADAAEVVARNAAIDAAVDPVQAAVDAVEATVAGHEIDITAVEASIVTVEASMVTLTDTVNDLSDEFDVLEASFDTTNDAVIAEMSARAAADAAETAARIAGDLANRLVVMWPDEEPDSPIMIPGPRGERGASGSSGGGGIGGMIIRENEPEQVMQIPGRQGPPGIDGRTLVMVWPAEEGEQAMPMPGPAVVQLSALVVKTADQAITANTALTDDTVLQRYLDAGVTYLVEIQSRHSIEVTPGFKCDINFTGTAGNAVVSYDRWTGTGEVASVSRQDATLNTLFTFTVGAPADGVANFTAVIEVTAAGLLSFRFAQSVSDAAAATSKRGSWMRVTRM